MSLDLSAVDRRTQPSRFEYDWKSVALYALGIGASADELDYLYEQRGPKTYPTFAAIPVFGPVWRLLQDIGADLSMLVHFGQAISIHRPIPPQGQLDTTAWVDGIYDFKRFAQVSIRTETRAAGEPCFETAWLLMIRGQGGFGGPRPPKNAAPALPENAQPDWRVEAQTTREQALLYRLSGDVNPLHIDPEFARAAGFPEGPILQGLCTFGYVGRALIKQSCHGNAARLKSLHAQFRKPVWPGDMIRTEGYALGEGTVALQAFAADRPDPVITNCWAEISN